MKFCMITSFFGAHSFGGDSVYVERLCQALLRRGHEVHVVYSPGAFESVRGLTPVRSYQPPEGLIEHPLGAGWSGRLDALWSHQTAGAGPNAARLRELFEREAFDVIHLHNVSLLGGRGVPRLASMSSKAVKLLTAHDYWWICPQSLLWKSGQGACQARACFTCNMRRGVPPQLWRRDGWFNEALSGLDAILFPSHNAMRTYQAAGVRNRRLRVLPGLLPEGWEDRRQGPADRAPSWLPARPFIAAAGRMVVEKGFQTVIPLMRHVPGLDLLIAGDGPLRSALERMASGIPNVKFVGLLSNTEVRMLFQSARAVVVPSLFPETFGLVVAEALALGTPVVARRVGAIPEVAAASLGAVLFDSEEDLTELLQIVAEGGAEFAAFVDGAARRPPAVWFEDGHLAEYFGLISEIRNPAQTAARP
jgi:glycosyltransferase involved in cell wall biosynthesis